MDVSMCTQRLKMAVEEELEVNLEVQSLVESDV